MLITLLFAGSFLLVSCNDRNALPDGFIRLYDAAEKAEGVMSYSFFEDYFSLIDIDGHSVGGSLVTDSSLLVRYQDEYYVNEEKFLEAMEIAKVSPEQRRKRYSLEDAIEMRGIGETIFIVKIVTFDSVKKDDVRTYTIKHSITVNTTEFGRKPFINYVTTEDGITLTTYNDYIDTDTVIFDMSKDSEIDTITFLSPDFPWFDYIISVDK